MYYFFYLLSFLLAVTMLIQYIFGTKIEKTDYKKENFSEVEALSIYKQFLFSLFKKDFTKLEYFCSDNFLKKIIILDKFREIFVLSVEPVIEENNDSFRFNFFCRDSLGTLICDLVSFKKDGKFFVIEDIKPILSRK